MAKMECQGVSCLEEVDSWFGRHCGGAARLSSGRQWGETARRRTGEVGGVLGRARATVGLGELTIADEGGQGRLWWLDVESPRRREGDVVAAALRRWRAGVGDGGK